MVVTVADVDDENRVGNSLLQIWKLRFGHNQRYTFVQTFSTRFGQEFEVEVKTRFEVEVWSVFRCSSLFEVRKLDLGQDCEARFGQDFNFMFSRVADVWLRF